MTKQITIYDLLPLLEKGWVAMDRNGRWNIFRVKPIALKEYGIWGLGKGSFVYHLPNFIFNIAPFDGDWKDSLIKVEHKQ